MKSAIFPIIIKTNKRSRSLRMTVNQSGEVVVTKPWLVPDFAAKQFVLQHTDWINKQLLKLSSHKSINNNQIWYRGTLYTYTIIPGRFSWKIHDGVMQITAITKSSALRQLEKEWKSEAKKNITKSVKENAARMKLDYGHVWLKDQSSRWGSCSSQKNLNFNWRLIMTPPEVLDYVVIHELAHLVHMDHSRKFWMMVEKFDVDYREHRRWLHRNGHALKMLN